MAILVRPGGRHDEWRAAFEKLMPDEELRWWPDVGDPDEIELLIAWVMPPEEFAQFWNLRAILSLGAGIEQWLVPGIPDVPVVRLADPAMADEMAAYALSWVLRHHRRGAESERLQRDRSWEQPEVIPSSV